MPNAVTGDVDTIVISQLDQQLGIGICNATGNKFCAVHVQIHYRRLIIIHSGIAITAYAEPSIIAGGICHRIVGIHADPTLTQLIIDVLGQDALDFKFSIDTVGPSFEK